MSYKKHLNDKLKKNELKTSKSRLFFISPKRVDIITEARMFFFQYCCVVTASILYLHGGSKENENNIDVTG